MLLAISLKSIGYLDTVLVLTIGMSISTYQHKGLGKSATDFFKYWKTRKSDQLILRLATSYLNFSGIDIRLAKIRQKYISRLNSNQKK